MQASCDRDPVYLCLVQATRVSGMSVLFAPLLPCMIRSCRECRLDEDDYGGFGPLLSEGVAPSISVFMVRAVRAVV